MRKVKLFSILLIIISLLFSSCSAKETNQNQRIVDCKSNFSGMGFSRK